MRAQSSDGYIRSTSYIDRYYGEFNPWALRYLAALHGFKLPDWSNGFNMCDLGCGSGMTALVLAAANPQASFWGVDFNEQHIKYGSEIRNAAGIDNCSLLNKEFGELHREAMPDMDVIAIHGVYSWVSEEVKSQLVEFARWKLKPGGILLITYNAMPGWSPLAPLRDFMREYALGASNDIIETALDGMKYLRYLADANAPYFQQNTAARQMLNMLERHDARYIAHEFFTDFWRPLYFREVAKDLSKAGVNFCGQFPLYLNYGEICLPEAVQDVIKTAPNRDVFETHKDFARNTMFRWDAYIKAEPLYPSDSPDNNKDIRFGLLKNLKDISFEMQIPGGRKITLSNDIYGYILKFFSDNCGATLEEAFNSPEISAFDFKSVVSAVQYLTMFDIVKPFARRANKNPTSAVLSQANKVFAKLSLTADNSAALASPVYGAGIIASRKDAEDLLGNTRLEQEQTYMRRLAATLEL